MALIIDDDNVAPSPPSQPVSPPPQPIYNPIPPRPIQPVTPPSFTGPVGTPGGAISLPPISGGSGGPHQGTGGTIGAVLVGPVGAVNPGTQGVMGGPSSGSVSGSQFTSSLGIGGAAPPVPPSGGGGSSSGGKKTGGYIPPIVTGPPPAPPAPPAGKDKDTDAAEESYRRTAERAGALGGFGFGDIVKLTSGAIAGMLARDQADWNQWLDDNNMAPPTDEKATGGRTRMGDTIPGRTRLGETIGQQPGQRRLGDTLPAAPPSPLSKGDQAAAQRLADLANQFINNPGALPEMPQNILPNGPGIDVYNNWDKLGVFNSQDEAMSWFQDYKDATGQWPWDGSGTPSQNMAMAWNAWQAGYVGPQAQQQQAPYMGEGMMGPVDYLYPGPQAQMPPYFPPPYFPFFGGYGGGGSYQAPPTYWMYPEMARGV